MKADNGQWLNGHGESQVGQWYGQWTMTDMTTTGQTNKLDKKPDRQQDKHGQAKTDLNSSNGQPKKKKRTTGSAKKTTLDEREICSEIVILTANERTMAS
jgi:hypothetical protein